MFVAPNALHLSSAVIGKNMWTPTVIFPSLSVVAMSMLMMLFVMCDVSHEKGTFYAYIYPKFMVHKFKYCRCMYAHQH